MGVAIKLFWLGAMVVWSAGTIASPKAVSLPILGVGLYQVYALGAPRIAESELRRLADADALTKCQSLYGPDAQVESISPHRYFQSESDRAAERIASYDGRYRCFATIGRAVEAVDRLVALLGAFRSEPFRGDVYRLVDYAEIALGSLEELAVPGVLEALKDANPRVRQRLLRALELTGLGTSEVMAALFTGLDDNDEGVRDQATSALRTLGAAGAFPMEPYLLYLLERLKRPSFSDHQPVFEILGSMGRRARPAKATLWAYVEERQAAESAGGESSGETWLPPGPLDAMADIGVDESDLPTIKRLSRKSDAHPLFRAGLVSLIGSMGRTGKAAVPFLLEIISQDPARLTGTFGHAAFLEALIALRRVGPSGDGNIDRQVFKRLEELALHGRFGAAAKKARSVFLKVGGGIYRSHVGSSTT